MQAPTASARHSRLVTRRPGPPSPAQLDPTPVPPVLLTRDYPRAYALSLLRSGVLRPVRKGALIGSEHLAGLDTYAARRTLALARIAAVSRQLHAPVMTHSSAAALWGLPLIAATARVHVAQRSGPSSRSAKDIARHCLELPSGEVTRLGDHMATTLERTVVDCAMTLRVEPGLILADAALHIGADIDECWAILDRMGRRPGTRRARTILTYADGGAESPGETRSRLVMLRAGLPQPETQVLVRTRIGDFWSDLGWPAQRVLGEYDGAAKYTAGGAAADAVIAEKRRQEAVEDEEYVVVRIDNTDIRAPAQLAARVRGRADFGTRIPRPELYG